MMPMQPGDVEQTWANIDHLYDYINYKPQVNLKQGLAHFVQWYKNYYGFNGVTPRRMAQQAVSTN